MKTTKDIQEALTTARRQRDNAGDRTHLRDFNDGRISAYEDCLEVNAEAQKLATWTRKRWRTATVEDVIPAKPKKCRVKDLAEREWFEDYVLLAVVESEQGLGRFAARRIGQTTSRFYAWHFCEVEDDANLDETIS